MTDRLDSPQGRLARDEGDPALLRLHRALSRLGSVLTMMNTGAHPDDEHSGLLAWLRFGRGMRVVVACSTRGEGGQNVIGPERGRALGLLRSREMEEAARVLDCDIAWLGFGPDDPVHDFGFSKDGDDTFARWGENLVVGRLVDAIRRERPDIVLPTFLDVPGQHGHHRAMTRAAETAIRLAADPDHRTGADPWTVARHYLPAWSGGGGTYDDEVPPPEATLRERVAGREAATGADFSRIGEWSRRRHASQGMGRWHDNPALDWPLHRVGGGAESRIGEGLPATLADLAAVETAASADLRDADAACEAARTVFPDRDAILVALAAADAALQRAEPRTGRANRHRVAMKRRQVAAAALEATGLAPRLTLSVPEMRPGGTAELRLDLAPPLASGTLSPRLALRLPEGISAHGEGPVRLEAATDAAPGPAFAGGWSPLGGNGPLAASLTFAAHGREMTASLDLERPWQLAPIARLDPAPDAFVRRIGAADAPPIVFAHDAAGTLGADLPEGWSFDPGAAEARIVPPAAPEPGLVRIVPRVDGHPAIRESVTEHPHVGPIRSRAPAGIRVLHLDVALPEGARIGWIGGGSDRTDLWLRRMGLDVTDIDRLQPDTDLSGLTAIIVGVVALANRPDVTLAIGRLHAFVREGGTLVTLYQRPDQGWDPDRIPPAPLTVGTPSLRWRVTDETAEVTILEPDHPILRRPNPIGPADWQGWDKERGLYFASSWDDAYRPLLAMSDAGEAPLEGALVSARIGRGRHSHVALNLHHQLDRMVPGAFRLMANLLAQEA
ncbi:PIG-L family deacetylase [Wenxinia saemankumensis]|uniref:N-acetylglucosaminyl deacetylase, LmbE family n=1 Tax=Wenxinia saemankumensis TaxID=1447782 RepID=A0A1M6HSY7_9RHOB|nr:PIG-L family deacetylase [Wenxinia saemankumensis]SHJ25300.1 N-acetylglucosaminyl deacetylase, LmbE family [Wenxinia saemankumensis]